MLLSEILFFVGFIMFIVAILAVDMLVIDKQAHVVSIREAGTWTAVWIILALLFGVFLWFHGDMIHGIQSYADLQEVTRRYASHINLEGVGLEEGLDLYRHNMAMDYITGYLIEKMLSVDNLFVMMMIFTAFQVSNKEYQHVLNWGILGAIVMRCVFIFIGSAIISRFDWVLIVFGLFLVYSAVKMFATRNKEEHIDVEKQPVVRFLSRYFRVYPRFEGDRFMVYARKEGDNYVLADRRHGGLLHFTPLLVTVVVIEFSDLIFAFDSIPAVFSVSLDPYVVFFSNIFAILGLRAMFFLLSAIADRFRYLKTGVCLLLLFIGIKLLLGHLVTISNLWSLAFILAVLTVSIVLSIVIPQKETNSQEQTAGKETER